VKKLPKYFSSKLITRNQSKSKLKEVDSMALESLNEDMKFADGGLRSTTLKGQDYADLMERQTPNLLSEDTPNINSVKKILVKKPSAMGGEVTLLST